MRLKNPLRSTSGNWTPPEVNHDDPEGYVNGGFIKDNDVNNGSRPDSNVPSSSSLVVLPQESKHKDHHSKDASNWDKFQLLMWKNYKLQIRHKVQTLIEMILPVIFTVIVVIVRCLIPSQIVQGPILFPAFPVNDVPPTPIVCCDELYYAPNLPIVQELMDRMHSEYFNKSDFHIKFVGFTNEEELERQYYSTISPVLNSTGSQNNADDEDAQSSPVLAGIVFTNSFPTNDSLPVKTQYKIRFPATPRAGSDLIGDRFGIKKIWFTEALYPVVQLLGPRAVEQIRGGVPGYYNEGFLYIQYALDTIITKFITQNESISSHYNIKLQRFPYPGYIDDKFLFTLQGILPLTLILSFIFPVINITKLVLVEKEKRLKEYMKMMGLPNWLHWTAWFLKSWSLMAISTLAITILLKVFIKESQLLPKSDATLIYATLMTHVFQLISFSFFMSTLFKTANSAAIVAALLWFILFLPFAFLSPRYNILSRGTKVAWCILTNIGVCFASQLFCMFEGTGVGAHWNTILQGATPDDTFCIADCLVIMFLNGVIFLLLTFYIEAVWPGEFGIPLPYYFPLTKWYWTGGLRGGDPRLSADVGTTVVNEYFESNNSKSKPGVQIRGITKKFGADKVAVKNLHVNMYEDEVFVLIGHNAAGKTTTMSMLAGIYPPTSGTAIVDGMDICKDIKSVRRILGLCPQSNVLFSELTVEEHLRFYCILKGLPKAEASFEVDRMIKAIGLESKRNVVASALSGGMKRRLSVGIAFCAHSKVVLLDEPSSGLDPGARRAIWDLIQNEKKGRTILLSTHYMDEADILGDRIAIMAHGELQCCGTSLFLKKKYGCGYHLTIVKESNCDVDRITQILTTNLGEIEEDQNVGAELSYTLPETSSCRFAKVFEELESNKSELGIASYGASITTLEVVFMRVGQLLHIKDSLNTCPSKTDENNVSMSPSCNNIATYKSPDIVQLDLNVTPSEKKKTFSGQSEKNGGLPLFIQQLWAMVLKKMVFSKRKYGLLLGQVAICVFYPSLLLVVTKSIPGLYDPPPHPIVLDDYERFGKTTTIMHCKAENPICEGYKKYLASKNKMFADVPQNESVSERLLELAEKDVTYVNFKYFVGFEENRTNSSTIIDLIGLFNNQPLHTPPLALNLISNAILNSIPSNESYEISVSNHPFGYGANLNDLGSYFTLGFQVGLHFALAMGFTIAVFAIFPIKERTLGSKHLQFVSGVNLGVFWVANFLVDLLLFFAPCLSLHLILVGFQVQDFYSVTVQFYLLLLLYSYAFAVLPLIYLCSLVFEVPSSGLVGMGIANVLTGYASLFVTNILGNPELEMEELTTILHRIFMIVPTYALGKGISQISLNYQVGQACPVEYLDIYCDPLPPEKSLFHWCCVKLKPNYLDWEELGIGKNLVYLFTFGLTCWIVLLLIDSGVLSNVYNQIKRNLERHRLMRHVQLLKKNTTEDCDVTEERCRIESSGTNTLDITDSLVVRGLTKFFSSNGTLAVDHISLGIPKGQCFGLLGANGAGKSTVFKMLTGELCATEGDAFVNSHSVTTDLQKAHMSMGYCPQFDAILEEMTGREVLTMYARLRGIPEKEISDLAIKLANDLLFKEFLDKVVRNYSGGNKRKLSTAVALVGNPSIVFLDEPTCGIDPIARRHLWDCISRMRDSGTSVIMTSHSMEETEFLCSRLAIIVNGKFRCIGSPQQLKSKFGEGYTITCQLSNESKEEDVPSQGSDQDQLKAFIETSLPGSSLEDAHRGFLHYRVQSSASVTWAQLFTVMEEAKVKFAIEAYSVGQTSLEQVFLNFIKAQNK